MFCYKENRFVSQTHGKREDAGAQWIDTHPAALRRSWNWHIR